LPAASSGACRADHKVPVQGALGIGFNRSLIKSRQPTLVDQLAIDDLRKFKTPFCRAREPVSL